MAWRWEEIEDGRVEGDAEGERSWQFSETSRERDLTLRARGAWRDAMRQDKDLSASVVASRQQYALSTVWIYESQR